MTDEKKIELLEDAVRGLYGYAVFMAKEYPTLAVDELNRATKAMKILDADADAAEQAGRPQT